MNNLKQKLVFLVFTITMNTQAAAATAEEEVRSAFTMYAKQQWAFHQYHTELAKVSPFSMNLLKKLYAGQSLEDLVSQSEVSYNMGEKKTLSIKVDDERLNYCVTKSGYRLIKLIRYCLETTVIATILLEDGSVLTNLGTNLAPETVLDLNKLSRYSADSAEFKSLTDKITKMLIPQSVEASGSSSQGAPVLPVAQGVEVSGPSSQGAVAEEVDSDSEWVLPSNPKDVKWPESTSDMKEPAKGPEKEFEGFTIVS